MAWLFKWQLPSDFHQRKPVQTAWYESRIKPGCRSDVMTALVTSVLQGNLLMGFLIPFFFFFFWVVVMHQLLSKFPHLKEEILVASTSESPPWAAAPYDVPKHSPSLTHLWAWAWVYGELVNLPEWAERILLAQRKDMKIMGTLREEKQPQEGADTISTGFSLIPLAFVRLQLGWTDTATVVKRLLLPQQKCPGDLRYLGCLPWGGRHDTRPRETHPLWDC